jgi:small lipoprotein (TIGR04452 family)
LIAGDLVGLDDNKYYLKRDVDSCISDIENIAYWLITAPFTPLLSCRSIQNDGIFLGDPLPSL